MTSQYRMEEVSNPRPQLIELSRDDVADLIAESEHAFLPSAASPQATTTDLFNQFAADPRFGVLGYVVGGRPASYVITLSHENPETLTIGPMYVGAEHRGRGLGRSQVEDFIGYATANGYRSIYTKTWGNNAASRKVFDDLGFRITTVKLADRADGDATVNYWLDLQPA